MDSKGRADAVGFCGGARRRQDAILSAPYALLSRKASLEDQTALISSTSPELKPGCTCARWNTCTPSLQEQSPMRMPKTFNDQGELNVVIETPRGSNLKYDYDPEFQLFRLAKALPAGMHFPYDFGFIPGTLGGDGDPLDILVLSPHPISVGCLIPVKLIGVLEAEQTEKESRKPVRNDRLIGCLLAQAGDEDAAFSNAKELPRKLVAEIEAFFIQYNKLEGKHFRLLGWHGPKRAADVLEAGAKKNKH
jgi:inorganic pyrophosphatase